MIINVQRKTLESNMYVYLDDGERNPSLKKEIQTPLPFFSHMLEQLAWRSEINIGVKVELDEYFLNHVICEDVGITLGKAFKEMVEKKLQTGAKAYGFSYGTIDEALARAVISFENRAYLDLNFHNIQVPVVTEGIQSEDLVAFWEGFVQGAQVTVHLDLLKGRANHGHHHWESIFRAAGEALKNCLEYSPWRKDMTAGVAGKIQFVTEVKD